MGPMIAALLCCLITIATVLVVLWGCLAIFIRCWPVSDYDIEDNIIALQPMSIPNGHPPIAGQID